MITAEKAREISGPSAEEYAEYLSREFIEPTAAKKGVRYVIVRQDPYASWLYNKDSASDTAKKAMSILSKNGFVLSLHYQELQFVDMGLKISWEL